MKNLIISLYLKVTIILLVFLSISVDACSGSEPVKNTGISNLTGIVVNPDKDIHTYANFNSLSSFGLDNGDLTFDVGTGGIDYMRFQNTAGTGILNGLEIKFSQNEPQGMVRMGVYSDKNNSVGTLLLDAGQVPCGTGWVGIKGLELLVESGKYYWLAFALSAKNTIEQQKGINSGSHYWFDPGFIFGKLPEIAPIIAGDTNPYVMRASVNVSDLSSMQGYSLALNSSPNVAVNWLTDWADRMKFTIDHTKISSPLIDFPILIHLSGSSGTNSADVSGILKELKNYPNRKKIAITTEDGITQCYVEIERWDINDSQAYLWVKVPKLSDTTDTVLYFYYDINQVDNTQYIGDTGSVPAQKVWEDGFVMVQHLAQSENSPPGEYIDSTDHHNNAQGGSTLGQTTPALTVSDTISGYAQYFNGVSDYIRLPDSDDFSQTTTGALTISFWISPAVLKFNSPNQYIRFIGKGDFSGNFQHEWQFVMYNQGGVGTDGGNRSQRISFYLLNEFGGDGCGSYTQAPIESNEWVYITGKVDTQYTYIYRDGIRYETPQNWVVYGIHPRNGTAPVSIGSEDLTGWFNGRMDEIRISNVARSDGWIRTSHYAESDKLIKFGNVKNRAPTIDPVENKVVEEGHLLSFTISATDPDYDTITYSASNLPSGAVFDAANGNFSWTPGVGQAGIYEVHLESSDGSLKDFKDITITVVKTGIPTVSKSTPAIEVGIPLYIYIIMGLVFAAILAIVFLVLNRRR